MQSMVRIRKAPILLGLSIFILVWVCLLYLLDSSIAYFNVLFPDFDSETSELFDSDVDNLFDKKASVDVENRYWISDPSKRETKVVVPLYYHGDEKRPPIQIFDPRLTLGAFLNQLLVDGSDEVPFSWYDWLDMSRLHKYILAKPEDKPTCRLITHLKTEEFCKEDKSSRYRIGFDIFKPQQGSLTDTNSALLGNGYLFSHAPIPPAILFNSKKGLYRLDIVNEKKSLLEGNLVSDYVKKHKSDSDDNYKKVKIDPVQIMKAVVENDGEEESISSKKLVKLDGKVPSITQESFEFDHEKELKKYHDIIENGGKIPKTELSYYQSLLFSANAVATDLVPKYFSEVKLSGIKKLLGDHYDWRFFSGIQENSEEVQIVLHRLIRNWLLFSRKAGLNTWVAHGSLLSWYWNGFAFPWDNDIDVQMPILDLHNLAKHYNQSVFVEDVNEGFGRYFIDVGLSITLRENGNGLNNIDARFIDMDTGMYIDITGLSVSKTTPPARYTIENREFGSKVPEGFKFDGPDSYKIANKALQIYNCRNGHFIQLDDIIPLNQVSIEGEWGFVPHSYANVLSVEYNQGTLLKKFGGHIYIPKLRLWVKDEDIHAYLSDKEMWLHHYNTEDGILSSPQIKLSQEGEVPKNEEGEGEKEESQPNKVERKPFRITIEDQAKLIEKPDNKKRSKVFLTKDELSKIQRISHEDLLNFLLRDELLIEYFVTREFTAYHEEEMTAIISGTNIATLDLTTAVAPFRPFRHDYFQYNLQIEYYDYEKYVSDTLKLIEKYETTE